MNTETCDITGHGYTKIFLNIQFRVLHTSNNRLQLVMVLQQEFNFSKWILILHHILG